MKKYIIDGHSHIGIDYNHGESNLNDYVDYAKKVGINASLLMPVPVPTIKKDEILKPCLDWKLINDKFFYSCNNPYQSTNYNNYEEVIKLNDNELQLFYVPLVHPVLDDISYLSKMVREIDPVALKVHGMWDGFIVDDIPKEFIEFVQDENIPIIAHCHYDNRPPGVGPSKYIVNGNSPYNWAYFFVKHKINGVINHGARLDFSTFNLVNANENLKIATGPDYISDKVYRWLSCPEEYVKMKGYLQILRENLNSDKLIFDVDYNWNTLFPDTSYDYDCVERTKQIWGKDSSLVLGENIINHMPKLKMKIMKKEELK